MPVGCNGLQGAYLARHELKSDLIILLLQYAWRSRGNNQYRHDGEDTS